MRYFRLLKTFYKNAILSELEYRANFFVNIVTNLFWLSWSVIGLQVFFNHTERIGGWTYDEALVVIGVFNVAFGFMEAFLTPNILEIGNQVRLGVSAPADVGVYREEIWRQICGETQSLPAKR